MERLLARLNLTGCMILLAAVINAQPAISEIAVGAISESSAVINWKTNLPANSQVHYGTTNAYGLFTLVDSTLTTNHSMILYGLAPGLTYHYQVNAGGSAGTVSSSGDNVFTTASLTSSVDSLDEHIVVAYPAGKLVPWTMNPADGYATVVTSAWNYLLHNVPNDPLTGRPAYYSRSYLDPNTQQVVDWDHNPAGLYGMLIESALKYYAYSGDVNVMQLAMNVATWHLDHGMTNATDSWSSVPYSEGPYGSLSYGGADQADGVGNLEPDKIGELAYGWFQLYKYSGNARFRDAAIHAADVLSSKIRIGTVDQSPWPFRVKASNGDVIEDYCSNVIGPISLLDALIAAGIGNTSVYQAARTTAWNWMMNFPMQNNIWAQYFEDVSAQGSYDENPNQYNAMMVARYLLDHPEFDVNWASHVRGLISWVENTFGELDLGATTIREQKAFPHAMGSHTSRYASVNALLYEKTGDVAAREKAYRSFNWATYMARSNGVVIDGPDVGHQWFSDGYGDYIRHFMTGMAAVPVWTPFNETHLLRSTSVVKNITYGPTGISYTTYDGTATEVMHVNFNPLSITANGAVLSQRPDLNQPGWTLDVATKTLKIYHVNATQVIVYGQATTSPPSNWGAFTGTIHNNSVILEWKTFLEINSKEFHVERGIDGVNFDSIATLPAAGNSSSTINYTYTDDNLPQRRAIYYRLKQVDVDGQYRYSNIIRLKFNIGDFYINNIYPTPASTLLHIDLTNVGPVTDCTLSLIDANGSLVKKITLTLNKGDNIIDADLSVLATGVYILKISNDKTKAVVKLIKE